MNIHDTQALAKIVKHWASDNPLLHTALAKWLMDDTYCDRHQTHKENCKCREMFNEEDFLVGCKPEKSDIEPGHTRLCMVYDGNNCDCWRDPRSKFYRKVEV